MRTAKKAPKFPKFLYVKWDGLDDEPYLAPFDNPVGVDGEIVGTYELKELRKVKVTTEFNKLRGQ